jgi:uncharacterized protein
LPHKLKYLVLPERLVVCRLTGDPQLSGPERPGNALLPSAFGGKFSCFVRTADEYSFVCEEDVLEPDREGLLVERGWVALKLEGPFPFAMTGVLASFIQPLAESGIPIFAISTFDTDYVLIKNENLKQALTALAAAGHEEL